MWMGCLSALAFSVVSGPSDPSYTIRLSSAIQCKTREHIAVRARFAPSGDLLAVVLQDYSFRSGRGSLPVWHAVLASRNGRAVRSLSTETSFKSLFWSPDSAYLAIVTAAAVKLIRVEDSSSCEVPLPDADPPPRSALPRNTGSSKPITTARNRPSSSTMKIAGWLQHHPLPRVPMPLPCLMGMVLSFRPIPASYSPMPQAPCRGM